MALPWYCSLVVSTLIKGSPPQKLLKLYFFVKAPVVQTLDSAIHRINYYLTDKY